MAGTGSNGRIGHLSRRPSRTTGLPCWALCRADGTVVAMFGADATREEVRRRLARTGLVLREDDAVWPAEPAADRVWEDTLARLLPRPGHARQIDRA